MDQVEEDLAAQVAKAKLNTQGRTSVSAEAFGQFNKMEDFKPRVIEKTQEQMDKIRKKLDESFMFRCLEDKEKEIVIGAVEEKTFEAGMSVIKQGDEGDCMYLVEVGELDCHKVFAGKEEAT